MRAWIYLLHFDVPYHHAQHYMGATFDLESRLQAHREGRGSKLTKVLCHLKATWRLSSLWEYQPTIDMISLWALEKHLKANHCGPRYCHICRKTIHQIPDAVQYDVENLPFNPHKEY